MKIYVREGSRFVEAHGGTDGVEELGGWCDAEGVYFNLMDLVTRAPNMCEFAASYLEHPCTETTVHNHWVHYGYICDGPHSPAAVVRLGDAQ